MTYLSHPSEVDRVRADLKRVAHPDRVPILQRFFKTGPGEYAEGDCFLGIRVPDIRKLARIYREMSWETIQVLLRSMIHEERLLALIVLVSRYQHPPSDLAQRTEHHSRIYQFYQNHLSQVNNWDLVDISAPPIVGAYVFENQLRDLFQWSHSSNLWKRRIAIVSTLYGIRHNQFVTTLQIAENLLQDPHDLIHKATGWMLREIGKRNLQDLLHFLDRFSEIMPRTMLRYAIERLPESQRLTYLRKKTS
jgi:3-methyladenine DNA glycosylase AlkD